MKEKTRIVLYCLSLGVGGAERQVVNIANGLNKDEFEVSIYIRDMDLSYAENINENIKIKWYRRKTKFSKRDSVNDICKQLYDLAKFIKEQKADLIYARTFPAYNRSFFAIRLFRLKAKLIVAEANYMPKSLEKKWMTRILVKRSMNYASRVYALTEECRKGIVQSGVKRHKVAVFPVVLDTERIKKFATDSWPFFEENNFNILTVGRYVPFKNHLQLIRSMKYLKNEAVKLYIMGGGELKSRYREEIQRLELDQKVELYDFRPNPYPAMAKADLFVFTSFYEGFGNALVEAAICGTPIIATRFSGMDTDLKKMLDKYKLLVEPGDTKGLANLIASFVRNPQKHELITKNISVAIDRRYALSTKICELEDDFLDIKRGCS